MSPTSPPPPLLHVHHVAIQVKDLQRSRAFYQGVLGLPLVRTQDHALWVQLGTTLVMLELSPGDDVEVPFNSAAKGLHLLALAIHTNDRSAWQQHLAQAGVVVVHSTAFTLYVRDPDGTRLALSHYPHV